VTARTRFMSPEATMGDRPQTSYERSEHAVSSFRWRNVDRSSNSAARCQSAIATRGGVFRAEIYSPHRLGAVA
jgi:hypothetical protein